LHCNSPTCSKVARIFAVALLQTVAQVSNLLYRRFPIGRPSECFCAPESSQGWQAGSHAIQQVGNLRYSGCGHAALCPSPSLYLIAPPIPHSKFRIWIVPHFAFCTLHFAFERFALHASLNVWDRTVGQDRLANDNVIGSGSLSRALFED
jgi:hypothetical protein